MSNIVWHEIKMTSNTTPNPFIVNASSEYDKGFPAWKAFDGDETTSTNGWVTANNSPEGWIQINLGSKYPVNIFKILARNGGLSLNQLPKDFKLEGSNNGIDFDILKELNDISNWVEGKYLSFSLSKYHSYQYYRLSISANNGGNYTAIGEIKLGYIDNRRVVLKNESTNQHYSLDEKALIPLPDSSSKNMILHGIEAGKEIQLDEAFDKIQYVNELSTVTNGESGKIMTMDLLAPTNKILKISEVRV